MTLDAYARFLTARWDEIEQTANHVSVSAIDETSGVLREIRYPVAREILADLAAKRAILDDAMRDHRSLADQQARPQGSLNMLYLLEVRNDVNRVTLEHLAAPFCDHPDHPANQEA